MSELNHAPPLMITHIPLSEPILSVFIMLCRSLSMRNEKREPSSGRKMCVDIDMIYVVYYMPIPTQSAYVNVNVGPLREKDSSEA